MLVLWNFTVASAQAAARGLSSLEVREQFAQCGYESGNPGSPCLTEYGVDRDFVACLESGALADRPAPDPPMPLFTIGRPQ